MAQKTTSEKPVGGIAGVVARLKPEFIGFAVIMALLLLTGVLSFAVYKGSEISILGIKIGERDVSGQTGHVPNQPNDVGFITVDALSGISRELFDPKATQVQLTATIRRLVEQSAELDSLETNFSYRLLKLELLIPRYGKFIDVRIVGPERVAAYRRIQAVLKEVGYFPGEITGDQQSTYDALLRFQADYNRSEGHNVIEPGDFGLFGYGTLEGIRKRYRRSNG